MTHLEAKKLLAEALDDIAAVRKDLRGKGPFASLLERAAVHIEHVRCAAATDNIAD